MSTKPHHLTAFDKLTLAAVLLAGTLICFVLAGPELLKGLP